MKTSTSLIGAAFAACLGAQAARADITYDTGRKQYRYDRGDVCVDVNAVVRQIQSADDADAKAAVLLNLNPVKLQLVAAADRAFTPGEGDAAEVNRAIGAANALATGDAFKAPPAGFTLPDLCATEPAARVEGAINVDFRAFKSAGEADRPGLVRAAIVDMAARRGLMPR